MDILDDTLLEPKIAQKRLRVAAVLVDLLIYCIICTMIASYFGIRRDDYRTNGGGHMINYSLMGPSNFLIILVWFLQFALMEGITGQTIGKRLFNIKVIKEDFTPTSVGISLARHLFDLIDSFFLIGLIVASLNKKNQRIGDLVARTLVVKRD
jgi:uncharacterized RDD family membrane protein YckC